MECSSPCCRQSTERKYTSRCPPVSIIVALRVWMEWLKEDRLNSQRRREKKKALAIDIIVDQFRESLAVFSRVAVVPVLSLMRIRVC